MSGSHYVIASRSDDEREVYFDLHGFSLVPANAYRYLQFTAAASSARLLADECGRETRVLDAAGEAVLIAPKRAA